MKQTVTLNSTQRDLLGVLPFDNFIYSTHISLKNHYVYVEVPKAGCSTIKYSLARLELENPDFVFPKIEMLHGRDFLPTLTPLQVGNFGQVFESQDFFKFCFVRNPYERLLSAYLDKIARPSEQRTVFVQQLGLSAGDAATITFPDFVDIICGQKPVEMDNHWRPQVDQTMQHKIDYDFVGRAECLDDDLIELGRRLGCDLRKYLKVEREHAQLADEKLGAYMTVELQQKVFKKYELDFERFNYAKALPGAAGK